MVSILIIDDSAFGRKMISKAIKVTGWDILEASNGKEGLEIVRTGQLDCILLDITMPEMNGREFLENLKTGNFDVPVIIVTADIQTSTQEEFLAMGAKAVITKPPEDDTLVEAVKMVIKG
ncbi:MAG: response regulator [Candidatus Odinarchaeota archaeon]